MSDITTALSNLQQQMTKDAANGPFVMDAAYLMAGLNSDAVTVSADYDAVLKQAFQIAADAFTVACEPAAISSVIADQFSIGSASITFIGKLTATPASLQFAATSELDGQTVLVVQIASSPSDWQWADSFPFMTGWPFEQLPLSQVVFYFSTAGGHYPWGDDNGVSVPGGAYQTLQAKVPFPALAEPYLLLFPGLAAPASTLDFSGDLNLSIYDGDDATVGGVMPYGSIYGLLSSASFSDFAGYLSVGSPSLCLQIPAPALANTTAASSATPSTSLQTTDDEDEDEDESDSDATPPFDQAPNLALSSDLQLDGVAVSAYQLLVAVSSGTDQVSGSYLVSLTALDDSELLSPATAISLMADSGSFFSGTPSILQQYLAAFGLSGMTLSGALDDGNGNLTVAQISLQLATGDDFSWNPLPAPSAKFSFEITRFSLDWSVVNPFATPEFSYQFNATFNILPDIFKASESGEDGVFQIEFDSDLAFFASFDGTASLTDFLNVVSSGNIVLPDNITANVSDIRLELDGNAQTFSFYSGFEIEVSFLSVGTYPILSISGAAITLSAYSASNSSDVDLPAGVGTVWSGSIGGMLGIYVGTEQLLTNVDLSYLGSGGTDGGWTLSAELISPIEVIDLITQFFYLGDTGYPFPDFLKAELLVESLAITCFIPSDASIAADYTVSTTFSWEFAFGGIAVAVPDAAISVSYQDKIFTAQASATWQYAPLNLELDFSYAFLEDGSQVLGVSWEGFTATYRTGDNSVTFTLDGWSLGTLIQALVKTLDNPYFTLPSPWDVLNQVSLDGLTLTFTLSADNTDENGNTSSKNSFSGSYTLSKALNLGFIVINGITMTRSPEGEVLMLIDGQVPSALADTMGNLIQDPDKPENQGQSIEDMPKIPGQGSEYFKLYLLALGQRVGIYGYDNLQSTQEVIGALQNVDTTDGATNPVNPSGTVVGQPYYNANSNWLIATHFGLFKTGDTWAIDLQLVFNDPNLYGMRLALDGGKVGAGAGLVIDILYKKISDDIGLFQIDFTFPDSIRNLNFGAVSVVLPMIGIQIYTNGDFLIDLGFPHNMDFSRSFSISAIVFGVPVLGSGGVYFGKLSNATATQVPQTELGSFNPVIVFGLGLQVGLGYNFVEGPLSAGFALTLFGIVEGVIATYHPYDGSSSGSNVQDTNYFLVKGTTGLIGMLYGTVDFKIITASVLVNITLSAQFVYESFADIYVSASARVRVSVTVKIDMGLFSVKIKMSYKTTATATFKISLPGAGKAPWVSSTAVAASTMRSQQRSLAGRVRRPRGLPLQVARERRHNRQPHASRLLAGSSGSKPVLPLVLAAQFTVLSNEDATQYSQQQGAYVCNFALDAPDPGGTENTGETSFDLLCENFFPWLLDLLKGETVSVLDLAAGSGELVTREQLIEDLDWLGNNDNTAFTSTELLQFLADAFTLNILPPQDVASATLFPLFDGLILTVPTAADATDNASITLASYSSVTNAYREQVAQQLREVAASISSSATTISTDNQAVADGTSSDTAQSMASYILVDVFTIIGRTLLQAGIDAFDNYAYAVAASDSIASIISDFNAYGNAIVADDISLPNAKSALSPALALSLTALTSVIQQGDTLADIASRYSDPNTSGSDGNRWVTTSAALINANGDSRILQSGIVINFTFATVPYVTIAGECFNAIAAYYQISLAELAQQSVLYTLADLLLATSLIEIGKISYRTPAAGSGTADSLDSIATTFAITVSQVGTDNLLVADLFAPNFLQIANLDQLPLSQVWAGISASGDIAQSAGQVARFVSYGLRLPLLDGLSFSDEFLYPKNQSAYSLYQITGQQFPTPENADSYGITLGRAAEFNGVDLSFIEFDGAAGSSMAIDLSDSYRSLQVVLDYAQAGKFVPSPSIQNLSLVSLQPKQFSSAGYSLWLTADSTTLDNVTQASNNAVSATPYLWNLPAALLNNLQQRQAQLGSIYPNVTQYADLVRLMPAYLPQKGSNSPNEPDTLFTDLTAYAYATRVDFKIARLAPSTVANGSDSNINSSDASLISAATDAYVYQLIGPSSSDAMLLQYLLTAMAGLGENVVTGLFLLYNAGGSDVTALTCPADAAFLSFITQTNLSTESTPASVAMLAQEAEVNAPNGIANSPAQFIKLLWEQAVVHGGGYYLYWQALPDGSGLPAAAFDASGNATLTMVATIARDIVSGSPNLLPNFINAFVSTETIDVQNDMVVVQAQASSSVSTALQGNESSNAIASLYGIGVGQLVGANSTLALVQGSAVPVSGILHQLTTQETQDSAQTLDNLAAYYSVGASQVMTADDIRAINPGVSVTVSATFAIPALTYLVGSSTAAVNPGSSFATMAQYYGLSLDALAVLAAEVDGLWPQNSTLTIETLSQDAQATQEPGNLSFKLDRYNYGEPGQLTASSTPAEQQDYAQASLFALYNTLSAGLAVNPYFLVSPYGLPFGPQTDDDSAEEAESQAHAELARSYAATAGARITSGRQRILPAAAHARSYGLAAAMADDYQYTQVLGFAGTNDAGQYFALLNPAPSTPAAGLPAASLNPYIGVGSYASIALRWQDLYGNTTLTPFTQPPADYTGALSNAPFALRYTDRLLGIAAWPKVQSHYIYSGAAGAPVLQLTLQLDNSSYLDVKDATQLEMASKDLAVFQTIYFQLNQDYSQFSLPGVTGNAVSMTLSNSLLAEPAQVLNKAEAQQVRDFVAQCVIFLQNFVDGSLGTLPATTMAINVVLDTLATQNLLKLDVEFILTRQTALVEPAIAALADGLRVASSILPRTNQAVTETVEQQAASNSSYTEFASALEQCLQTAEWYMQTGVGLTPTEDSSGSQAEQLYVVRFGKVSGQGVYFEIGDAASYYAPLPVATSLQSRTVTLADYPTGVQQSFSFNSIDLNLWFDSCLSAIDKFLSATYAPHAFILDQINGYDDPLKEGDLGKILAVKQDLADAISATTTPILSSSAIDSASLASAAESMRQQLLTILAPAFNAGASVVFALGQVSGADSVGAAGPPRLYGQPTRVGETGSSGNQNYTLSAASIPLANSSEGQLPRLVFNFASKNVDSQAYVALDLNYQITHMEFERAYVPGIDNYVESQWLAFVNPTAAVNLGTGTQTIPVLNRALPLPPTVNNQTALNPDQANGNLQPQDTAALAAWDYGFDYSYRQAAQDTVDFTVLLNVPGTGGLQATAAGVDLFTALADFISNYAAVSADLDQYLTQIDGTTQDPALVDAATLAVSSFQALVSQVTTSYIAQFDASERALAQSSDDSLELRFEAQLSSADDSADGTALYYLREVMLSGSSAHRTADGQISNGIVTLNAPVIEILPETYMATQITPPTGVIIAYSYPAIAAAAAPLSYQQALAEAARNVTLTGLNVMVYKNAQSSLYSQRNKFLVPEEQADGSDDQPAVSTSPEFLYQTPVVKFTDPILPRITWASYDLRRVTPIDGDDVTAYMKGFFKQLFAGASGQVKLGMSGGYSYNIAPGLQTSGNSTLPRTYLPINLLQPIEIMLDADNPPAAAIALTEQVALWFAQTQPTTSGAAAMDFKLSIFSDLSNEQLLLQIEDIFWTINP